MNKEEIEFFETRIPILRRHYVLVSEFNGQINEKETKKLFDYIGELQVKNHKLQQQNKKYKEVIDKAIMYIHLNKQKTIGAYGDNEDDDFEIELWEEDIDKLLDILKEVE